MQAKLKNIFRFSKLTIIVGSIVLAYFNTSFIGKKAGNKVVKTVVIDAGHGGKDPGCHGVKFKEKDVSLSVALKLGKFIEDNFKDIKVVYTRKTDVFIELNQRAAIANKANADLFICIHCNASPNKNAFGSETYVMGLHKTKGNLDVAKRENASILLEDDYKKNYEGFDPNSDEAAIIFSLYQNTYLNQSLSLASKIQKYYKEKAGRVDKGVKQAGFLVLWKTAMPSLLSEIGFLTNIEEEKFLGSDKGQDYIASALFMAFRDYKNEMEGIKIKYEDDFEKKPIYVPGKEDADDAVEKQSLPNVQDTLPAKQQNKPTSPKIENTTSEQSTSKANTDTSINRIVDVALEKMRQKEESKPVEPIDANSKNKEQITAKQEVIYRVQFLSHDKSLPKGAKEFKGVDDFFEYQEGGKYKYAAGNYSTLSLASKAQTEIRKKGFPDAFVVKFIDNKKAK